MKVSMIALSQTGKNTGDVLKKALEIRGMEVDFKKKSKYIADSMDMTLDEWTVYAFKKSDVLIWICACGIAVRHIAPYLKSKKTDPAVIAIDECGKFAISLLSGHLGGANELTLEIAEILDSIPVVTTATDLHKRFAVDVFSKKNNCEIRNMQAAKEVSAALLANDKVGVYSEFPLEGKIPKGLILCDRNGCPLTTESDVSNEKSSDMKLSPDKLQVGIAITIKRGVRPFPSTVTVIPKSVVLGIGCRRGKETSGVLEAGKQALIRNEIYLDSVEKIASIDLKKEEQGIIDLSNTWKVPFETYSEETLRSVEGEFSSSDFVKHITGVDNVCERSAVYGSQNGELIQKKVGKDGVTTALALNKRRICFE